MSSKPPTAGAPPLLLSDLDAASDETFLARLGDVVEHSPWVVGRAAVARPFGSVWALHAALLRVMREASPAEQVALAAAHPELAGREAIAGEMTDDSNREQARLGLTRLSGDDHGRLAELNRRYRDRFGYPFITAVRLHRDLGSIFAALECRLGHAPDREMEVTLAEIGEVVRGRLAQRFGVACGWLSTHVLDTSRGLPAVDMAYSLARLEADRWRPLAHGRTNAAGRSEQPVLVDQAMQAGTYQLEFAVGDYFRRQGFDGARFLDRVPLRFVIDEPDQHYHLPLLCSPFSYSTYRGS